MRGVDWYWESDTKSWTELRLIQKHGNCNTLSIFLLARSCWTDRVLKYIGQTALASSQQNARAGKGKSAWGEDLSLIAWLSSIEKFHHARERKKLWVDKELVDRVSISNLISKLPNLRPRKEQMHLEDQPHPHF